jgi:hypothetical protein
MSKLTQAAQNAYDTATKTGFTYNPHRPGLLWMAHEIGIHFAATGRTRPSDCSKAPGPRCLECNGMRFTVPKSGSPVRVG